MLWFAIYIGIGIVCCLWTTHRLERRDSTSAALRFLPFDLRLLILFPLWPLFIYIAWCDSKIPDSSSAVQADRSSGSSSLVGRTGKVIVALRPAGRVVIDSTPVEALSDGPVIEEGTTIEVVSQDGMGVRCRIPVQESR